MAGATLHFLDWTRSALDGATEFLARSWKTGPLDLRDTLVIVPTRHAGRRLRERLAVVAGERNSAVLTGTVETPSRLFAPAEGGAPLAGGIAAEAFWRITLSRTPPAKLAALGSAPLSQSGAAQKTTAARLAELRNKLCEEGHTIASFAEGCAAQNLEPDRWQCLAELERAYLAGLEAAGWRDDVTAKLEAARNPSLPAGTERIVVLFAPDPPPLALTALDALSARTPVAVCVHAPESARDRFDPMGRPLPDKWRDSPPSLPDSCIEVCDNSAAMIESIRAAIRAMPKQKRTATTVGAAPDTAARAALALNREGVPTFDPSGTPVSQTPLFSLMARLADFRENRSFERFSALARQPDALRRLDSAAAAGGDLLPMLDEFQNERIPATADDARAPAAHSKAAETVARAFEEADEWARILSAGPLSASLPKVLSRVYEGATADRELARSARSLRDLLDRIRRIEPLLATPEDAMDLLLRAAEGVEHTPDRTRDAVDLLGWLELPWEDAPVLLIADMNDGIIPEAITADPFLPDAARRAMKLRDNDHRLARDAYALETAIRSRQARNLRCYAPRRNAAGDPLRPSRLLFRCADRDLPARAARLFSEPKSPPAYSVREPGWLIAPPVPEGSSGIEKLHVTGFRSYLECPFMFYMKNVLGMEPWEEAFELDPRRFGTICHEALERFARSPERDETGRGRIERSLHDALDGILERDFGARLSAPILAQREILRMRLAEAAGEQARLRAEGWRIRDRGEVAFNLALAGVTVSGRIDRIDEHEDGRIRVIDYKTSAKSEKPEKTHLKKAAEDDPGYALTRDRKLRWLDLQLPLYVAHCETAFPEKRGRIECAYFTMPNAAAETAAMSWRDFEPDLAADAVACAERVAKRILAGVFWPPRARPREDDPVGALFFGDVEGRLAGDFKSRMERIAGRFRDEGEPGSGEDR